MGLCKLYTKREREKEKKGNRKNNDILKQETKYLNKMFSQHIPFLLSSNFIYNTFHNFQLRNVICWLRIHPKCNAF